jgi:hypothetical protein
MLRFPNPSRSYDDSKKRICFWGYDSAIEVSFFIDIDTLKLLSPEMSDFESGFLETFDDERDHINAMASKVYREGSNRAYSYILLAADARK